MADETSGEVLSIVVDVETKEAKKKLAEWNAELAKATTEAAKKEKLLSIASSPASKSSKGATGKKYATEMAAIRKEAAKLAKSYATVDKMDRTKKAEKSLEAEKKAAEKLWEDRSLDGADKKVWDEKKATVASYYSEIEKGAKKVKKYLAYADEEPELSKETLSKFKGTFIPSGEILGDQILFTKESDKDRIRTEEIADGYKKIREYIRLSSGELYLMSERTSRVAEKTKKSKTTFEKIKDDLKNQTKGGSGFFKKIGSIITYRIARTILSAITNAFKQGFSLLSNDNDVVGKVKDQFSSIATTLQVSLTTILIPLFESLANILEPIATDFLNMANAMSLSNAQLKGQSQFFELSKEKIDAYAKSLRSTNKQLSQLDKFATLNDSQAVDLGGYRDVADVTEEETKNLSKYEKSISSFKDIIDSLAKVGEVLGSVFKFISENIDLVVTSLAIVVTATNPLLGLFGSMFVLFSDASNGAKGFAAGLLILAGALIGLGIAKQFALNPIAGAVAGLAGAGILAGIVALITSVSSGSASASTSSFSSSLGGTSIGGSDIYSGIATSTQNGYTAAGGGSVHGNVYMDGKVVGKVVEDSVYAEGTRVGHFGRK